MGTAVKKIEFTLIIRNFPDAFEFYDLKGLFSTKNEQRTSPTQLFGRERFHETFNVK
jgi:hypothetical protein